ncbi:MAG: NAD(P)H-hydrate dehydratase [Pseudomonadales bacterium]
MLYSGTQCAAIDHAAVTDWGFAALDLMTRAGTAAFAALQRRWPAAQRLCICAGVGNNAGDAYVVAELAQGQGLDVQVLQLAGRTLGGHAGVCQQRARSAGVDIVAIDADDLARAQRAVAAADVVVDGLLGIGLRTAPRPLFAQLIGLLNDCGQPVLALDVPSGLDADASAPFAEAVQATLTVTFVVDKVCLRTGIGAALAGAVQIASLGLPARLLQAPDGVPQTAFDASALPPLAVNAYKHGRGHVVIVGGDHGMGGAVVLAAQAALRAGAGLVSVITRGPAIPALLARCPEVMAVDTARWPAVLALLQRATVVVCGPGLGQGPWGRTLFAQVLDHSGPRVFDADALNLLATCTPTPQLGAAVLTPHSGEAARLLDGTSAAIERDRLASAQQLATRFAATVVLKGPGSLVVDSHTRSLCPHGNPGMASAGMGDVLSGIVAAVVAQTLTSASTSTSAPDLHPAVAQAVAWHSAAADVAATAHSARALLASDVIAALPGLAAQAPGL